MSDSKKNILILSYFFPPCNRVGGRRWAKFAKYLQRLNYSIQVVSVNYPYDGSCPWEKDTDTYKKNIIKIPHTEQRPYYEANKAPHSLVGKIRYRLSWYQEKLFPKKYNEDPIDIADKDIDKLKSIVQNLILSKKINTIIITGGPFRWVYELMKLKNEFKEKRFILDLRDFWTNGVNYQILPENFKKREDLRENESIKLADVIFTPAERIMTYLIFRYPSYKNKIKLLPHAFDAEELPGTSKQHSDTNSISFAYAGILYPAMEGTIERLIELLTSLKISGLKVRLDLYAFNEAYRDLFIAKNLNNEVFYHKPIPPNELFKVLQTKDYLLQLRAGLSLEQHFKSTKFYELIALRRPIVYFGPEGDIEHFLVKHHLGLSGNAEMKILAEQVKQNKITQSIPDTNFDVSDFEFTKLTKQLVSYL